MCRPSALVSKDEEIAKLIDEKIKDCEDEVDLIDAEEQAQRDILAEREAKLAAKLTQMRKRKRELVDPLQYALSIAAEDLIDYVPSFAWEMAPPSETQLAFLEKRGIFSESIENMGKASLLIDRLKRRQEEGLSTPKQIRCLERYGFRQVGTWLFEDAGKMISRLAINGWRVPRGITVQTYKPSCRRLLNE